ncbi:DUF350 domain-containing protein [Dongshaea marina]|uniref:DUF350 domain-containing protein n=1 Tax=Dongshaea marina TaxID=2047966 RepID=UPI000D3E6EA2|nr:DUF350 domain-containing protein [Dongshaea marina]
MQMLAHSLAGIAPFAAYFVLSLVFLLLFKWIYVIITPYDEWKLIKEDRNTAAAIAFSGAILGYSVAIAGAAKNSVNVVDFIVWAVVALIAQLIAFAIVRFGLMPKLIERINNAEISAGIVLAAVSLCVGLLNAACMSY